MYRLPFQTSRMKNLLFNQNQFFARYIRSVSRREIGPKLVEGKVKTVTNFDDAPRIQSYKDFIKSVKETELEDETEVEKEFYNDDYHGDAFERCDEFFNMYESKEKALKSNIKKKIIGRKYFKLDRETNLLTYSAKEQIRYLHKSNPLEWNSKAISECFPISENGAKKLLNCSFELTCPEKIKEHDKKVAELWKILKSGKPTHLIAPLTQKLYKEGKLVDDYFSGNPNLPTAPPSQKVVEVKKKKVGEFSAIVQTYAEYIEKQKLLESGKETDGGNEVSLRGSKVLEPFKMKDKINKKIRQYKFESEENDNRDPEVYPYRRNRKIDPSEIPFSQFKEILKDETSMKLKTKYNDEYDEFVMQQTSVAERISPKKSVDSQDCFLKIPKYEKSNSIHAVHEKNKNVSNIYMYDEKIGYQHPVGKNFKNKIKFSPAQRSKGKLHKVGQCVYDDHGEFLYKVPT